MDSYTKLRIIGTGSFGTVWLVRSKSNQRNYVLKEIPLSVVHEKDRDFVLNEVLVLSRLRHKNIIRYKEAFLTDGLLCISMEFAYEGDLFNRIQKQNGCMFPREQVIDWFIQLCLSLKYIHGMKILHRDIKSQNIFLTKDSVIKLGDFGIACVLQNTLDHAQTVIGTPYYLSPEICQRQPYNHKSDIWALGCVLYEMITLRHPFEASDFTELVLKILHGDYQPIPESHGQLLRDLVTILLRVKPGERPSAKQILHIPAMQPYVDQVLARGRTQKSESVSCASNELLSGRQRNVWRKPDIMPVCCQDQGNASFGEKKSLRAGSNCEESSRVEKDWVSPQEGKTEEVDKPCEDLFIRKETGSVRRDVRSQRKRASSEVFCCDHECYEPVEERTPSCKTKSGEKFVSGIQEDDKENITYGLRLGPTKQRAYSTSIVRESAERRPLTPLNKPPRHLGETYEVIRDSRQLSQETYTVLNKPRSIAVNMKTQGISCSKRNDNNKGEGKGSGHAPSTFDSTRLGWFAEKKTMDFIKILLTRNHFNLGSISPADSMKSYMDAIKSYLEKKLGAELLVTVYKYLAADVKIDLDEDIDITVKLFEAMGQENVVYVPLILQLIRCENSFL